MASCAAFRLCGRFDDVSIAIRDGEFFHAARALRLRQNHAAAHGCRVQRARCRAASCSASSASTRCRRTNVNTGMVFQNYAVFPNLTVGDNVAYGLRARKIRSDEIKARVERALKLVQLPGYGERWPHQLSGGQHPACRDRARGGDRAACACCSTSRCPTWTPSCGR